MGWVYLICLRQALLLKHQRCMHFFFICRNISTILPPFRLNIRVFQKQPFEYHQGMLNSDIAKNIVFDSKIGGVVVFSRSTCIQIIYMKKDFAILWLNHITFLIWSQSHHLNWRLKALSLILDLKKMEMILCFHHERLACQKVILFCMAFTCQSYLDVEIVFVFKPSTTYLKQARVVSIWYFTKLKSAQW